jgi:hypothetical protein
MYIYILMFITMRRSNLLALLKLPRCAVFAESLVVDLTAIGARQQVYIHTCVCVCVCVCVYVYILCMYVCMCMSPQKFLYYSGYTNYAYIYIYE